MKIELTENEIRSLIMTCYCKASEALDEETELYFEELAKKLENSLAT